MWRGPRVLQSAAAGLVRSTAVPPPGGGGGDSGGGADGDSDDGSGRDGAEAAAATMPMAFPSRVSVSLLELFWDIVT